MRAALPLLLGLLAGCASVDSPPTAPPPTEVETPLETIIDLIPTFGRLDLTIDAPSETMEEAPGTTLYGDVLEALGPPAKIARVPGGFVFLYEHLEFTEHQLGMDFQLGLELSKARARGQLHFVLLSFDDEGRLRGATRAGRKVELGTDLGLGHVLTVRPRIRVEGYAGPSRHHDWGRGALAPFPASLGREVDLDSGADGLEQRNTPTGTGQHLSRPESERRHSS